MGLDDKLDGSGEGKMQIAFSLRRKAAASSIALVSIGLWNTGATAGSEDMPQKPIDTASMT